MLASSLTSAGTIVLLQRGALESKKKLQRADLAPVPASRLTVAPKPQQGAQGSGSAIVPPLWKSMSTTVAEIWKMDLVDGLRYTYLSAALAVSNPYTSTISDVEAG